MEKDSFGSATIAQIKVMRPLDDRTAEWVLKSRKISRETLELLRVGSGTAYFPELQKQMPALFFPYENGWKARAIPKKAFACQAGTKINFWGLDDVLEGDDLSRIYIVEGEMDRCALVEAGIFPKHVIAAPGASGNKNTELEYVKEALAAGLSKCACFVICTDSDQAGLELRQALAQVLGPARCEYVDWPEGSKDANDHLKSDGPLAVRELVEDGSRPWPTYGLYLMSKIPKPVELARWRPGFEEWGDRLFLSPGTMSVATGQPGHGKTLIWAQIWFNVVKTYDLVACVATFETRPRPHYQRMLRQFYGMSKISNLDLDVIRAADNWIDEHYVFMQHPEQRPTLDWLLGQAEIAVTRHKAKVIQIDPFNRLEGQKEAKESETDYIAKCLRACYTFAVDMQVHMQIIAHPAKSDPRSRGYMPALEDIAGSKHWENMVDQGFTMWRPRTYDDAGNRQTYAELHHLKARFDDLGYPSKFGLDFDMDQGRFGTCQLQQPKKKQQAKPDAED